MEKASEFGSNLPEKNFRVGTISASVWRNTITKKDGTSADVLTVSFDKRYKDKDSDEWKSTKTLRSGDLPKAVVLLNKAYEYILMNSPNNAVA